LDVVCVCFKLGVSHCQRRGTNFLPTIKDISTFAVITASLFCTGCKRSNKESKARQA
jgi:hypothetical protein